MNYDRYFKAKIIYIITIFISCFTFLKIFDLTFSFKGLIVIFKTYILLYLLGNFEFRKVKLKKREYLDILIVNLVLALGVNGSFEKMLYFYSAYTFSIIFLKVIIIKLIGKKINVMYIGSQSKEVKIKKYLNFEIYDYKGNIGKDNFQKKSWDEVREIIKGNKINKLIVESKILSKEAVDIALELKLKGIKVVDYIDFIEDRQGRIEFKNIDNLWLVKSRGFEILNSSVETNLKRLFDVLLSSILIVLTSPLIIISCIIIRLESKGSVIFKQSRVGVGKEEFQLIKLRSMKLHNPNEHSKYAGESDVRITKFGKFMRKTRIDELPQLWLILKGEMSFIGPRPEWNILCEEYRENIGEIYDIRHLIKPGVTGWAQVMYKYGAGLDDAKNKLEYDLYYVKNFSFMLDMIILFKTLKIVVFGKGK